MQNAHALDLTTSLTAHAGCNDSDLYTRIGIFSPPPDPRPTVHSTIMARRFFGRASNTADESADQLHKLCRRGDVKEVREYVEQIHNLDNQLTSKTGGLTPLHEAVKNGHYRVVDYLLNKVGSVVNCPSDGGYTPLHFAASKGHVETLMVLLKHGADVKAEDEYGKTPKQTAELSSKRNAVRILRSAGNCRDSGVSVP